MKHFEGKVTVITGAASGFGLELARLAARRGMKLVLADVQEDALDRVRAELEGQGSQVLASKVDVSRPEQIERLAEETMRRFGAVHLLFNNAGVASGGLLWESTHRDWEWVLGVNLWGVITGVRVFVPLMLASAAKDPSYEGHVVNTSSMAGLLSPPNMGVYNVSKHGVVTLTETLHHDLRLVSAPIGTSVLCPFFVPTGIHESERNRPFDMRNDGQKTPSQKLADALSKKAVTSGKVTAAQVAEMTFDAVEANRFYIVSHPQALDGVRTRMEDILEQRQPTDPLAAKPAIGSGLRASLKAE